MVGEVGLEPTNLEGTDLQSAAFAALLLTQMLYKWQGLKELNSHLQFWRLLFCHWTKSLWCLLTGSNRRHSVCRTDALPAELRRQNIMAGLKGFEPMTNGLTVRRSTYWAKAPIIGGSSQIRTDDHGVADHSLSRLAIDPIWSGMPASNWWLLLGRQVCCQLHQFRKWSPRLDSN